VAFLLKLTKNISVVGCTQNVRGRKAVLILPTPRRLYLRPLVTVCGSFNKHIREIKLAVEELFDCGAIVLSPQRPVTIDRALAPGFLLLDSDRRFRGKTIKAIEDGHIAAIARSDFVVLVCPGGYIGTSVAMEMGAARLLDIPLYAVHPPVDDKMGHWVTPVPNLQVAVDKHRLRAF
jgi:hypothetical protein